MMGLKGLAAITFAAVLLAGSAAAAPKTGVRAAILSIAPADDGRAVLHLDRGSRDGLRRGMAGDVVGLDVDATIIKVSGRRSQAMVKAETRDVRGRRYVVFTF